MKISRLLRGITIILALLGIAGTTTNGFTIETTTRAESELSTGFCDYFTSPSLNSGWTWVDPLGDSSHSLTANPGHLRLYTPDGGHDLYLNLNAPRMLQPISGDFVATTKVTMYSDYSYQGAGLLIWQDSDNYIRLELNGPHHGINYVHRIDGVYFGLDPDPVPGGTTVYLRFMRAGNTFSASFSGDGSTWQDRHTVSYPASDLLYVGLSLLNEWQDHPIWADFDYFELDSCGPPQNCTVPFFSQRDPSWRNHPLRTNGECSAFCSTIGTCGCTLTSATMLFAYYGAEFTPPTLSDCMGTSACPFNWGDGASCTNGKASNPVRRRFNWTSLDQQLNQDNRPVILGMHRNGNTNDTHWVLVTSGQGSDPSNYTMHDPWPESGANHNLNVLVRDNYVFDWLVVYDGQPRCTNISIVSAYDENVKPIPAASLEKSTNGVSEIVSSTDITGTVSLYMRSQLTMTVRVSATSTLGQVTEMQVWTDANPSPIWQPFSPYVWLPWYPEHDTIYARFRDEFDNISDVVTDTTHPIYSPPPAPDLEEVFLPIILNSP